MSDQPVTAAAIAAEYPLSDYVNPTQAYAATGTDFTIACQQLKLADSMVKHDPRVWVFQFASKINPPPPFEVPAWYGDIGNYHAVDHDYWFSNFSSPVSANILDLSAKMRAYLTSFAADGDPNDGKLPLWKPLPESSQSVMNFATPLDPNWNARKEHHCEFWNGYNLNL